MKLALPAPPRRVRLAQVPGALGRLAGISLLGLMLSAATTVGALRLWRAARAQQASAQRSIAVDGTIAALERGSAPRASVLYAVGGTRYSASSVEVPAEIIEPLRVGSVLRLSVDPMRPERPLEPRVSQALVQRARWSAGLTAVGAALVWLGALLAIWLTARRERRPLREGLLVWLTTAEPIEGLRSVKGHYFRQDVRYDVRARARPSEAPIRNGEKVLAAVAPPQRRAVVIDERLAKRLGWLVE